MHPTVPAFHPRPWLAYFYLALSMTLVGSYVALSKPLVAIFSVFLLAWLRFGIGGLSMLHWLKRPANEAPMTTGTRGLVFLESFLGNFLFSICMLFGVSMTSAVAAGVIMASIGRDELDILEGANWPAGVGRGGLQCHRHWSTGAIKK